MTTLADLRARWEARRAEGEQLRTFAPLATLADLVLAELRELELTTAGETVSREEAATIMEVHPDSVTRMLRRGSLRNVGTPARPRFLRAELPRKGAHPKRAGNSSASRPLAIVPSTGASSGTTSGESIARDAVASRLGR